MALASEAELDRAVKVAEDGKTIQLDAGPIAVRIPATQTVVGKAPGPVVQVRRGTKWVGSSTVEFPGHQVTAIGDSVTGLPPAEQEQP